MNVNVGEGLSRKAIDQLGERLRRDQLSESDLRLLHEFRGSFQDAYDHVVGTLRARLGLQPLERPEKSTPSIRQKLRRRMIRLSRIQDIAGCRVVVESIRDQDDVVFALREWFPGITLIDRRENPSSGYRAVHAVVRYGGRRVEIQIRTFFQQKWAELSEKLTDVFDPAIKYGGGPIEARILLERTSGVVTRLERYEAELEEAERIAQQARDGPEVRELIRVLAEIRETREKQFQMLAMAVRSFSKLKEEES